MAKGGQAAWVLENIRGGFNNVEREKVMAEVEKSKKKGWSKWLRAFFRA